ncbi:MAG: hypothetical protein QXN55_08800 [Candidatus Nitrosotenuis sp.]
MDALYTKITRPDPDSNDKSYTDHTLSKDTQYCCDAFKSFCKKFPSWSYQAGKFTIVDTISYDNTTQIPISYCPFCGEKIKYKEIKKS